MSPRKEKGVSEWAWFWVKHKSTGNCHMGLHAWFHFCSLVAENTGHSFRRHSTNQPNNSSYRGIILTQVKIGSSCIYQLCDYFLSRVDQNLLERTHQLITRRCFIANTACIFLDLCHSEPRKKPWRPQCTPIYICLLNSSLHVNLTSKDDTGGGWWLLDACQDSEDPASLGVCQITSWGYVCFWWPVERVGGAVGLCGQEDWGLAREGVCKSQPVKTGDDGTVWWEEKSAARVCSARGPDVAGEHTVM